MPLYCLKTQDLHDVWGTIGYDISGLKKELCSGIRAHLNSFKDFFLIFEQIYAIFGVFTTYIFFY